MISARDKSLLRYLFPLRADIWGAVLAGVFGMMVGLLACSVLLLAGVLP